MANAFEGKLYGPGQPQDGAPARGAFIGNRLRVDGPRTLDADAVSITVESAGFEHDHVLLAWSDADGDWGLLVADAAAKGTLIATAPPVLAKPLGRWRRSVGLTHGLWRAAIGAAALLALGAVLLWWQYDAAVAWTAARISPETERRMGVQMIQSVAADGRLIDAGTAHETIQALGTRLAQGGRFEYRWYLVDDPRINAFALPGGFIVINTGLVNAAASADELAAVMAHELQHVEQRHSLQGLIHQLGWATLLTLTLGDASAVTSVLLLQAGNTVFSRELETQADLAGVATLARHGVPPAAMAEFFKNIQARIPDGPSFLSSHPATGDRIAAIEGAVAKTVCPTCAPSTVDWAAVRTSLRTEGYIKGGKVRKKAPKR